MNIIEKERLYRNLKLRPRRGNTRGFEGRGRESNVTVTEFPRPLTEARAEFQQRMP
jgi:hypothetical protein